MSILEIIRNKKFIEVWLTNEEQEAIDRKTLTNKLLADNEKRKVVFFLSGSASLIDYTNQLLIHNI
ncbi:MAG: hypothetical protein K2K89_10900 [Ruminococcus sp.]|nr:hypothetical protein [Ruminococcus sp.]